MGLLSRVKRAVTVRGVPKTRAAGQARESLRALVGIPDQQVLSHLNLDSPELTIESSTLLVRYFQSRQVRSPLFRQSDRRELAKLVAECFPESYEETLRRADLACRHVVEVLGSGETYLGDPINWWTDFQEGTWTQGDYETLNATLYVNDFQNPLYIGDIKLPWELNKHAHFLELAKAYWLTADERFAEALLTQLEDWIERNPFLWGIAWTQNLIVAQRVINWVLSLQAIWQSPALTPSRLLRILRSLYQHARYIPVHFEFAERASNHLFGNAAGLAALALAFPEFREAQEWCKGACQIIESELGKQVHPDGVHYEQSIGYHRYVLEFCLLPWLLAGVEQPPYTIAVREALERMLVFLLHMTQPTGQVQPISDADGARVWRFNAHSINDHRGLLNLGALLMKNPQLKRDAEGNSEDVLWWCGPEGFKRWKALPCRTPPLSMAFPNGGYFVLREAWHPNALWVFLDCGHVGMGDWPEDVSVGTHGHSDLLTVGLAAGGETLLTDLGSYTYTRLKPWHDYFRSARGHNVVLVDGEDQGVLTTTWALRQRARPREVHWRFSETTDFVTGAHDGYRRLKLPVLHRRSLLLLRNERRLILRDDLEGCGAHTFEALFHGMPSVSFLPTATSNVWRVLGTRVGVTARFLVGCPLGGAPQVPRYRVAKGETAPIDGWYSTDYGVKEPAPVLHLSFAGTCPVRLYTVLDAGEESRAWATYGAADDSWCETLGHLGVVSGANW